MVEAEKDSSGSSVRDSRESSEDQLRKIYRENLSSIIKPKIEQQNMADHHGIHELIKVKGTFEGHPAIFALDSGATGSIINELLVKEFDLEVKESNIKIKTADGLVKTVKGIVGPCEIKIGNMPFAIDLMVMPQNSDWDILLGLDYLKASRSAIYFDEDKFVLGDCSVAMAINNQHEVVEVNSSVVTNEEEKLFQTYDIRDEFEDNLLEQNEFEKFFKKNGYFMKKENYTKSEKRYMNDYVNLNDLVKKIKSKEGKSFNSSKPRIWKKPGNLPEDIVNMLFYLIAEFDDLFAHSLEDFEGACKLGEFRIYTDGSAPVYKHPYSRSPKENQIIKEEVELLLKHGFIRKSTSPWGAPTMLVPKAGGKYRMVCDLRGLNKVTIPQPFPLPKISDIFDRLRDAVYYSAADCFGGFQQIKNHKDTIPKLGFVVWFGHFEWLRMPYGARNAPSQFCRLMQGLFGDLDFVLVYVDDIIIFSKTVKEHIKHLKAVFERLRTANLKLNGKKCSFLQTEIKILGHYIEHNKVKMDKAKIDAISDRKKPNNVKELQVFLGICNFYRKFIKDFAAHVKPLTDLLHKDAKWNWDKSCQEAFDNTKIFLTSYPILRIPDHSKEFILYCDASNWALGLVLGQIDDDKCEYVCAYASRTLRGAEKNYSVTEKECLGVIFGLKEFRVYLLNKKFKIYTDHVALQWLLNIKDPIGKLYRWAVLVQQFEFEIVYKKGSKHQNADTLSRPVLVSVIEQDDYDKDIFKNKLLMNFVKTGCHVSNTSRQVMKKLERDAKHYNYNEKGVFYRKLINDIVYLKVPDIDERVDIVLKYHN